jgi:hypothetical protein
LSSCAIGAYCVGVAVACIIEDAGHARDRERNMKHEGGNDHRGSDGAINEKYGSTTLGTLRKVYGRYFAAGHDDGITLADVMLKLNETSLSQLRRDHETGHLKKKLSKAG